jgi:hypothetical protein
MTAVSAGRKIIANDKYLAVVYPLDALNFFSTLMAKDYDLARSQPFEQWGCEKDLTRRQLRAHTFSYYSSQ